MSEKKITEAEVSEYLRNHLDFFVKQPRLLQDLRLPHESGSAISLVEKQVSLLRERNIEMRHRLSSLLDNAKDNDRLFEKTKRLVLALLESRTLADSLSSLLYSFNTDFKIHYTSVILFGDKKEQPNSQTRIMTINQAREHIGQILKNNKPVCGTLSDQETSFLFPDFGSNVGSIALVPLIHGNTFGVLAIGNRDPNYYRSSMGTLFLSYIGEVLNRLLPKQINP